MKTAMRRGMLFGLVLFFLVGCGGTVLAYGHRYDTGRLSEVAVTQRYVVMSGKAYRLKPKVKVILKVKKRGAYYEESGSLSDLRVGDRVFLKVFGPNDVLEIEVMR